MIAGGREFLNGPTTGSWLPLPGLRRASTYVAFQLDVVRAKGGGEVRHHILDCHNIIHQMWPATFGVHLDHRIGDRRAGGERHPMPGVLLIQVSGFHVYVERPFPAAGLDAGDALHLGRCFQIFEIMHLVDEDMIDAEFVEYEPVIFLVFGQQVLQPFGPGGLLFLDGLDEIAVGSLGACVFAQQLVIFGDLLQEEFLLVIAADANALEAVYG